ncbi:type I-C CRISPR-associated protein Cas5c [Paenibacillus profundus]|uniref:pre-crRNA processing endonuclease n=1 Tax=Paenibacillus profundus TaxID=1173085 RepID=A0ABS8YT49_9BACL|nr:type I-C CRISPR-associated protein Cas5c [Paenibacillus profundus]MCE5173520.1 type I-C CRISPR-associated protein Cas5c [Paenibacillus profundus]
MGYGVRLQVWGEYACFTRPEMKAERVSYDVITPSAARGVLEAIHWKPALRWVVDRIHVLNEIRFDTIRRNELESKISAGAIKSAMKGTKLMGQQVITEERQQRATMMLRKPSYLIEAHFELTSVAGETDTAEKHYNMFIRRARQGQCFHRPYLGCREFDAHFAYVEDDEVLPDSFYCDATDMDLGWMLWDMEYSREMEPLFYRPVMHQGIIEVPDLLREGVKPL